jgi:biopolymer transport protein ExbD
MSMNVGDPQGDDEVMVEMNTTPLIDVMLVLITMLVVTLPIQTHAVKLDMPRPNQTPPAIPPVTIDVAIDFDGTITWPRWIPSC